MSTPEMGAASEQTLMAGALEWVVKKEARSSAARHLVHRFSGNVLCHKVINTKPVAEPERGRHRPCRACLSKGLEYAKLAPIDFSAFEVEDGRPEHPRDAWQEATRTLLELAAWTTPGSTADHLEKLGDDLAAGLHNADAAWFSRWWAMPVVEHPLRVNELIASRNEAEHSS